MDLLVKIEFEVETDTHLGTPWASLVAVCGDERRTILEKVCRPEDAPSAILYALAQTLEAE